MAPAHALLLLGATADLFCSLVKPEDKIADLPKPKAATTQSSGESVPKVKISSSSQSNKRKPSVGDFSFKHKLSSFDSLSQHKVSRTGSQTKRKISPSDGLPLSRMSVSEPRFQRRISLTDMPHGQVMSSKSVPIRHPTDSQSGPRSSQWKLHSVKRPSYQFRSLSTEIPTTSCSSKHKPVGPNPSYQLKGVTSSESELKTSYSDISPISYHVRNISRDS